MLVVIVIKTDASLLTEQANEWCRKPTGETRYTTPGHRSCNCFKRICLTFLCLCLSARRFVALTVSIDAHKGRLDVQGGQHMIAMGTPESVAPGVAAAMRAQGIQGESRQIDAF